MQVPLPKRPHYKEPMVEITISLTTLPFCNYCMQFYLEVNGGLRCQNNSLNQLTSNLSLYFLHLSIQIGLES